MLFDELFVTRFIYKIIQIVEKISKFFSMIFPMEKMFFLEELEIQPSSAHYTVKI